MWSTCTAARRSDHPKKLDRFTAAVTVEALTNDDMPKRQHKKRAWCKGPDEAEDAEDEDYEELTGGSGGEEEEHDEDEVIELDNEEVRHCIVRRLEFLTICYSSQTCYRPRLRQSQANARSRQLQQVPLARLLWLSTLLCLPPRPMRPHSRSLGLPATKQTQFGCFSTRSRTRLFTASSSLAMAAHIIAVDTALHRPTHMLSLQREMGTRQVR